MTDLRGGQTLRDEVREFLHQELQAGHFVPTCNSWMDGHDPIFSHKLGVRGWIGMTWPRAYGGADRTAAERFIVIEELLAAGAPVAAHWFADRQVGPQLVRLGTEDQKRRYLPAIAAGACYFAIGMSEPNAGSDLSAIGTSASRTAGGWIVSGQKVWTSHAHLSHYMLTLCRRSRRSSDRHAGMSQLIIDLKAKGVDIRPIGSIDGASHFAEVLLDDVFVPDKDLLGEPGRGWDQVTAELAFERSGPERFLSVMPLVQAISAQLTDEELGHVFARLSAVRQLCLYVAGRLQAGEAPAIDAALVKALGTRLEQGLVEDLTSRSLLERAPLEQQAAVRSLARQARLAAPGFSLRGGTTEILNEIVGKALTG
jgi:alkylation response protein AidB-like acyl-CoA dehydrogenase